MISRLSYKGDTITKYPNMFFWGRIICPKNKIFGFSLTQSYLRNRYYSPTIGRFITEDPIKDGLNWYAYCGNNPVMFVDPWGLEVIVVAGGAYHADNGNPYQYTFVDSALKELQDLGGGTLLVANAGWTDEQRSKINQAAADARVNLLWFSSVDSLTTYINTRGDGRRMYDSITSFSVYAHGTDVDSNGKATGEYAITFGLYTSNDFRWYTSDISKIKSSAFAKNSVSKFYACRTGNDFENGNFAQSWAYKTGGMTYAYSGINGRSNYENINGTRLERHGVSLSSNRWKEWYKTRGEVDKKPGAAYRSPEPCNLSSMTLFLPITL